MKSVILWTMLIALVTGCDGQDPSQTYVCSADEHKRVFSEAADCLALAAYTPAKCYQDSIMRICHQRFDNDRPVNPFKLDKDGYRGKETFPLAPIPENLKQ